MRMNADASWLRKMAELEDGCLVSTGGLVESIEQEPPRDRVPMKPAFLRFVELARRERSLSLEQFAEKADVDLVELLRMETEIDYTPAIRTFRNIANFLEVPQEKLLALAGLLQMKDTQFQTAALKFAARSATVERLSTQEHSDLEEIVKMLCETAPGER